MDPQTFEEIPNPVIDESLKESLKRGESFESMMSSESWSYVKAFIEIRIKVFANRAIKEGFKDFSEYQLERGKVLGLSELLSDIENDLRILNEQRQKSPQPTEQ
jgi:hypothetical protein